MKLKILLMMSMLLVAACASQLPLAANHPLSTQKKIRSSHHWDVIADDVANQTLVALSDKKQQGLQGKPLYVQSPPDNTSFNKAFRNFLITRMVNRGIPVSKAKENAQEIQYELQLVRHNSSRYTHIPGTLTALAAGISVVRDIVSAGSSAIPTALGLGALADYGLGHYSGGPTKTELIITTSIISGGAYSVRKSDVYYVEDADTDLFVEALERPAKQWQIVGK